MLGEGGLSRTYHPSSFPEAPCGISRKFAIGKREEKNKRGGENERDEKSLKEEKKRGIRKKEKKGGHQGTALVSRYSYLTLNKMNLIYRLTKGYKRISLGKRGGIQERPWGGRGKKKEFSEISKGGTQICLSVALS